MGNIQPSRSILDVFGKPPSYDTRQVKVPKKRLCLCSFRKRRCPPTSKRGSDSPGVKSHHSIGAIATSLTSCPQTLRAAYICVKCSLPLSCQVDQSTRGEHARY